MRENPRRRWLGSAILVLVPALAVTVFGLRAVATDFAKAPDLPGGILLSELRTPATPAAAKAAPRDSTETPVVDMATWLDTAGPVKHVSVIRR
jgi:hypothetical protein